MAFHLLILQVRKLDENFRGRVLHVELREDGRAVIRDRHLLATAGNPSLTCRPSQGYCKNESLCLSPLSPHPPLTQPPSHTPPRPTPNFTARSRGQTLPPHCFIILQAAGHLRPLRFGRRASYRGPAVRGRSSGYWQRPTPPLRSQTSRTSSPISHCGIRQPVPGITKQNHNYFSDCITPQHRGIQNRNTRPPRGITQKLKEIKILWEKPNDEIG